LIGDGNIGFAKKLLFEMQGGEIWMGVERDSLAGERLDKNLKRGN
jgi:predicted dinucleotide-binding enzyme